MVLRSLSVVAVAAVASALHPTMPRSVTIAARPRSLAPVCCALPGDVDLGADVACGSCGTWVPATGPAGAPVTCTNCGASISTSELDTELAGSAYETTPFRGDANGASAPGAPGGPTQDGALREAVLANAAAASASAFGAERTSALTQALLRIGAATGRGEMASEAERDEARRLAADLDSRYEGEGSPSTDPRCAGTWELVLSDTQLFRSSPFFMAGRAVCADGSEARRYDAFCDLHRAALAISTIGKVRQIVSLGGGGAPGRLTSEFEVRAGTVPFVADFLPRGLPLPGLSGGLPLRIDGAIVTSASIEDVAGDGWALYLDTVQVKGSNIPGLRQVGLVYILFPPARWPHLDAEMTKRTGHRARR